MDYITSHATHPVKVDARDVRPTVTTLGAIVAAGAIAWSLYSIGDAAFGLLLAYAA